MSLPAGFLEDLRGRVSLGQVVGRKLVWDQRKSNPAKGDFWAPCPFHQEKTASFHVDDKKGYYYCFGCHAKGDAITFVRETENVGFLDAVEILAREAGLAMPARDPQARAKADRRSQLVAVMEEAARFFQVHLRGAAGARARDYLEGKRGLDETAQKRWDIGFAPDAWQDLWTHLRTKGIAEESILGAGLAKRSQKGGNPYDTFRNRIMFPIRDARGRCIAFGGRAMAASDPAKYLNSPETELFDKGRILFNHGPARAAVGQGHTLIVAEGYMDVIALAEHGFEGAVAPLGTAITDAQLQMLWRIAPEPMIALDGDAAGQRAVGRVIDLALPLLRDANSLFFLALPEGLDPDDYLKTHGRTAFAKLLEEAKTPLVRMLWERELYFGPTDTPEQKAGLNKRIRTAIGRIPDADIRRYYKEVLQLYWHERFRPPNWAPEYKRKPTRAGHVSPQARASLLARGRRAQNLLSVDLEDVLRVRERIVAALAIAHMPAAHAFAGGLEMFEPADRAAAAVIDELLTWQNARAPEETEHTLRQKLGDRIVGAVLQDRFVKLHLRVLSNHQLEDVTHEMAGHIALAAAERAAVREVAEAEEEIGAEASEILTNRLRQSRSALYDAYISDADDASQYEISPSGARINRAERDAFQAVRERTGLEDRDNGRDDHDP